MKTIIHPFTKHICNGQPLRPYDENIHTRNVLITQLGSQYLQNILSTTFDKTSMNKLLETHCPTHVLMTRSFWSESREEEQNNLTLANIFKWFSIGLQNFMGWFRSTQVNINDQLIPPLPTEILWHHFQRRTPFPFWHKHHFVRLVRTGNTPRLMPCLLHNYPKYSARIEKHRKKGLIERSGLSRLYPVSDPYPPWVAAAFWNLLQKVLSIVLVFLKWSF